MSDFPAEEDADAAWAGQDSHKVDRRSGEGRGNQQDKDSAGHVIVEILERGLCPAVDVFRLINYDEQYSTTRVITVLGSTRHLSTTQRSRLKFVQFTYKNNPDQIRVGFIEAGNIVDINAVDPRLSSTFLGILRNGQLDKVHELKSMYRPFVPFCSVNLKAPIHDMDKVIGVTINYKDYCKMHNVNPPKNPVAFGRFASTIIGPEDPIRLRTTVTKKADWEVELCVVIGKKGTFVKEADARNYVMGCTVAQDITARDWRERNGGQILLAKSMDTFCPIGPWIVTCDETGNFEQLDICCSVNGCLRQSSNTSQLIHKVPRIIEYLSEVMTLLPGDLILTGTPAGVGDLSQPPTYLKPGDVICSQIQNIGLLETKIVESQDLIHS